MAMRYGFAALGLAAVLCLLPALSELPKSTAAPAPARYPDVYALVYVGTGHNEAENGKLVVKATEDILREFPDTWRKKIRIARLEGTAVLRIWTNEGKSLEQAQVINKALEKYYHVNEVTSSQARDQVRERLELLCFEKRLVEINIPKGGKQTEKDKKKIEAKKKALRVYQEEIQKMWKLYDSLPRPLEWATVKDKR
jgi:hypothetical protein